MSAIYVAGPSFSREGLAAITAGFEGNFIRRRDLPKIYDSIRFAAQQHNMNVFLPERDLSLREIDPAEFFGVLKDRISECKAVVSVFTAYDSSTPAESAIAALLGKKQLLVCANIRRVPRILRGLPGITQQVEYRRGENITPTIYEFIRQHAY